MEKLNRVILATVAASSLFVSGCGALFEAMLDSAVMSKKEIHEQLTTLRQDPTHLQKERDREKWVENQADIKRQEVNDEATRRKKFDETFEKLRKNQKNQP